MIEESKNFADWLREQAFAHRPSEWVWMVAWAAGGHHLKLHHYADHQHGELARTSAVEDIEFYGQATSATLAILDTALLEAGVSVHGSRNCRILPCLVTYPKSPIMFRSPRNSSGNPKKEPSDWMKYSRLLLAYAQGPCHRC